MVEIFLIFVDPLPENFVPVLQFIVQLFATVFVLEKTHPLEELLRTLVEVNDDEFGREG